MLKGTATIELTDVKTGQKEVVKHDNLVTNAINDLLTLNPLGMRFRNYVDTYKNLTDSSNQYDELGGSFEAGLLPIIPKAIGGLLLYEKSLEENPDEYYANIDNPLVGYSSNDANEGVDTKRGSMNQTESGALEDGTGYRFVFDFSTSQANGTISALGLTSARGGKAGYGSVYDLVGYPMLCVDGISELKASLASNALDQESVTKRSVVSFDPNTNTCYYARVTDANTLVVGKNKLELSAIGLTGLRTTPTIDEKELKTASFASVIKSTYRFAGNNYQNCCGCTLVDGGDGYIWGFQHKDNAQGNSSGVASVLWIKIDKRDLSFEEGEWSIDAQMFPFGVTFMQTTTSFSSTNNTIIKDGKLYALKYDKMGVYVIDMYNVANVELLPSDFEITTYQLDTNYYNNQVCSMRTNVSELFGVIVYHNAYINGGHVHKFSKGTIYAGVPGSANASKNYALSTCSGSLPRIGPFKISIAHVQQIQSYVTGGLSSWLVAFVYLMTPYLATINNLDTPVTKTADKTMKITYILREE